LTELKKQLDECESEAELTLSAVASDLKLESGKSVKLESNGQVGFFFRVTLKDEKKSRTLLERNYETISTKSSGVSFRNGALQEINETFLKARREYEQQQQSVVKEILGVACT